MKRILPILTCILMICANASSQYVGIGTTTPGALLDVAGDARINGLTIGRGAGNVADNTVLGNISLSLNTSGFRNVGIGKGALHYNTTGSYNVSAGTFSLWNNTIGTFNSAFGNDALNANNSGIGNTGIGCGTLYFNTTGSGNTAVGYSTGFANITGSGNTFIGYNADAEVGDLVNATAIGTHAFVTNSNSLILGSIADVNGASENTNVGIGTTTPGARLDVTADILINGITIGRGEGNIPDNTAIGNICLSSNTTGNRNVGVGMGALNHNISGTSNVANGTHSLWNNTTGSYNSAFGDYTMNANITGSVNTVIGQNALQSNIDGDGNIAIGSWSGSQNVSGSANTFIGTNANPDSGGLSNATAIGNRAFVSTANSLVLGCINGLNGATVNTNVGIGTSAPAARLDVAADILINGIMIGRGAGNILNNTVVGNNCLVSNTTGYRNVGIGYEALHFNTTGFRNVAVGSFCLQHNTTGWSNSAFGDNALYSNTDGSYNMAIGFEALYANIQGYENVALGHHALYSNTNGIYNAAIGNSALSSNTTGSFNIAIGDEALSSNTTGGFNIAIGREAGSNSTGSGNTFIGVGARPAINDLSNVAAIGGNALVGSSNSIVLGSISGINGATANTNVGIGTTTPAARLDVAADILINGITIGRGGGNATYNTAIGDNALNANTIGEHNTGSGFDALANTTTGSDNTAFGFEAGLNNTEGWENTFIGKHTRPSNGNLSNATAIGSHAYVSASNAMVLGMINGINGATSNTNVGIGTTNPSATLEVAGTLKANAWKTASMAGNGYAEMGGVLLQWGTANYTSSFAVTITFPKAFVNVYSVTATVDSATNSGSGANVPVKVMAIGNNTFQIAGTIAFSGDNVSKIRWMAVGN